MTLQVLPSLAQTQKVAKFLCTHNSGETQGRYQELHLPLTKKTSGLHAHLNILRSGAAWARAIGCLEALPLHKIGQTRAELRRLVARDHSSYLHMRSCGNVDNISSGK